MKHLTYLGIIVFVFVLTGTNQVYAEQTLGGVMRGVKASTTESREVKKASTTERRIEVKRELLKRQADRAETMLTKMLEHLERLAERVASRVEKIKAEGGVVTESERFLGEAKTHLSEARASLDRFSTLIASATKLEDVKSVANEVKLHLRKAHEALVSAVSSLKPGRALRATSTTKVN